MLKESSIDKIASILKTDPVKLKQAISSDREVDVYIPESLFVADQPDIDRLHAEKRELQADMKLLSMFQPTAGT